MKLTIDAKRISGKEEKDEAAAHDVEIRLLALQRRMAKIDKNYLQSKELEDLFEMMEFSISYKLRMLERKHSRPDVAKMKVFDDLTSFDNTANGVKTLETIAKYNEYQERGLL